MILQNDIFRFCCKLIAKYEFYLYSLDRQISKNLSDSGVETRPVQTNGLWCFSLLPTVLILYSLLLEVSPSYTLVAYTSVGLLFYCMLFTLFLSLSCVILKESMYGGCIASSLISTLLLYVILGKGLAFSFLFSLPTVFTYSVLLRTVLMKCPKTFTIGEAMVVTQAIILFIVMIIANMIYGIETEDKELYLANVIVYTVLMTVGLLIAALYVMPDDMRNMTNLGYIVLGGVAFLLLVLQVMLGIPCVVKYIFKDETRTYILGFWLSLVCMSIIVLLLRTKLAVKADTVARKTFHILASLVFLSGILHDLSLIKLAAGVGLGALIFIEALRKSSIEPISSALQSAFLIYCDEKDCGVFAVTPLYLFAGLACPLTLVPSGAQPRRLELLSGVLALGVGDTAASWLGSRYGHNKWPGGTRTLEGTAFNILSQVATVYALEMFDLLSTRNAAVRAVVAATASGLVEARTDQVDNLILPLVTIVAFQSTLFLS